MSDFSPLLARGALWGWAARCFWYPDGPFQDSLGDPHLWGTLQRATTTGVPGSPVAAAVRGVRDAAWHLHDDELGLAEEYTYLFERQVPVSPHEGRYSPMGAPGPASATVEVSGFYAAFGFQVAANHAELPDHVSMECEFVAALLAKEALARAEGRGDHAKVIREACAKFLREHLAGWFPTFAMRLEEHRRLAFYPAAARLVLGLLAVEEGQHAPGPRGAARAGR